MVQIVFLSVVNMPYVLCCCSVSFAGRRIVSLRMQSLFVCRLMLNLKHAACLHENAVTRGTVTVTLVFRQDTPEGRMDTMFGNMNAPLLLPGDEGYEEYSEYACDGEDKGLDDVPVYDAVEYSPTPLRKQSEVSKVVDK